MPCLHPHPPISSIPAWVTTLPNPCLRTQPLWPSTHRMLDKPLARTQRVTSTRKQLGNRGPTHPRWTQPPCRWCSTSTRPWATCPTRPWPWPRSTSLPQLPHSSRMSTLPQPCMTPTPPSLWIQQPSRCTWGVIPLTTKATCRRAILHLTSQATCTDIHQQLQTTPTSLPRHPTCRKPTHWAMSSPQRPPSPTRALLKWRPT